MCDCLIIGFNDYNLGKYVELVKSCGVDSGAYKDLDLALIKDGATTYRALDILSRHYFDEKRGAPGKNGIGYFHNTDFIWPTIMVLGSYLAQRGFTFDYVNLFHLEKDKLREKLTGNKVLTVAITTTLYVIPQPIIEIIEFVRGVNDKVKIIVGGPYISNQMVGQEESAKQSLFGFLGADIYVDSTEGEGALVKILAALKSGGDLRGIDNIAYKARDRYVIEKSSVESNPLEENPINYSLFPQEEIGEFVSLRTAKSCPFACSFCGFPQRAGKYKYLSVALVEKDLNVLRELESVTTLTFLDDTFNVPKERFKEMLRMMIRNGYNFKWNSYFRSDHSDEEVIDLMGRAGCEGVFLGVESGSDTMLQKMNKTARSKDYRKAIPLLKANGIFTHANLIMGFPGDTFEIFEETRSFIEETRPDTFRAQLWYADPVTPVWKKKEELGIKGSGFNWSHHTMDCHTACDLVDQMFLSIKNSIWLPQNGFELWSIFYLQRKGMNVPRIKQFLNSFNAIIREKLVSPGKEVADPTLLEDLRQKCQFNDSPETRECLDLYSASAYCAAEEFWANECASKVKEPTLFGDAKPAAAGVASKYFKIDGSLVQKQSAAGNASVGVVLLAAYAVLLLRWKVRDSILIVADFSGEAAFPLRLTAGNGANFKEVLETTNAKTMATRQHAAYGFHILTNPVRLATRGYERPALECGCTVHASDNRGTSRVRASNLNWYASVEEGLALRFEIMEVTRDARVRFLYDRSRISRADIEELSSSFEVVLREADSPAEPTTSMDLNSTAAVRTNAQFQF